MPELPEVEIVKQSLNKIVKFKTISKVIVNNRNLRFKIIKNFEKSLEKKRITKIFRKSKYIIFQINFEQYLIMHLGMSGTIHMSDKGNKKNTNISFYHGRDLPEKHNHLIFFFDKFKVVFNDPRRFGFVKMMKSKDELINYFSKLGPEPLGNKFNTNYLKQKFNKSTKNIKNSLLDQNLVSGIGNIYASEILFRSKINPLKKVENLTLSEISKIISKTKFVLSHAIKKGGSSIRDFKNVAGFKGNYQKEFMAYSRENYLCLNRGCESKIIKININNRATYYCKNCQK